MLAEPLAIRARRFRGVFVCGLQEGEFPLSGVAPSRSSPTSAAGSWPRARVCVCARARMRSRASATCSTPASHARPSGSCFSYRSSDEEGNLALASPFIADVERPVRRGLGAIGAGSGCWRMLCGRPTRRRRSASSPEPSRRRRAPSAGGATHPPRALGPAALERRPPPRGSSRRARWRPTRTARSNGWSSGSWRRRASTRARPDRSRQPHARGARAAASPARGTGERPSRFRTRTGSSRASWPRAQTDRRRSAGTGSRGRGEARSRPICAATSRTRRPTDAPGSRRDSSCGSVSRSEQQSLPPLALGEGSEQIRLRGVIDRVDVDPDRSRRAIVRDYKSGQRASRAPRRALAPGSPAAGCAVHARGARAARARAGRRLLPAAWRRRPRAARRVPRGGAGRCPVVVERRQTAARSWTASCRRCRSRGGARGAAAPRRAHAVPADLLARRLPLPRDLPGRVELTRSLDGGAALRDRAPRAATCCSTRAPAAARPRCWSSASCARCSRTASRSARSSRSPSPRRPPPSCATGSARVCASSGDRRGGAGHRGRVHLDDPRLLRPRPAGPRAGRRDSTRRSPCSTSRRRGRSPDAAFDDALEDLAANEPGGVELIAAYGPRPLRGAILGVVRRAALARAAPSRCCRRCRAAVSTRTLEGGAVRARASGVRGRRPSLALVAEPSGPRSCKRSSA